MTKLLAAFSLAGSLTFAALSPPAMADMMSFKATLDARTEVPPNDSAATGTADIEVNSNTRKLTWTTKYDGLTGPATAAHFHGPADPGANAGPVIDISDKIESGTVELTEAQLTDLQAGKLYVNIHTQKYPNGEIRGQVMK